VKLGASFTALTVMLAVALFESTVPSFTLNATVLNADWLSPKWRNLIERSAVW
jgi:hypothetical protein